MSETKNIPGAKDSDKDKIKAFKELKLYHPNLLLTFKKTMELIEKTERGRVHLVYGPTGVGKTTLLQMIKLEITERNQVKMEKNRGLIPVVDYEIVSEGSGKFNWKDFYIRFLENIDEPLISYKKTPEQLLRQTSVNDRNSSPYRVDTARQLRVALEKALYYRGVEVVLFDEAQHFLKIAKHKSMYEHMDALKSIANLTGTTFVLFGSFDLIQFLNYNAQTSRRTNEIYFPRYDFNRQKDKDRFVNIIMKLDDILPFEESSNLIEYADLLYSRSIGCIGILKNWLDNCVDSAVTKKLSKVDEKLLLKWAPSSKKAYFIAQETTQYEQELKESSKSKDDLYEVLGMNSPQLLDEPSVQKYKRQPGERCPTRDKVGRN